jgi:phage shock protein PspC (stress-responsive transcriptional regulator)
MIAGVAGGLANYLDMDPTIVRVLWVAVALLGGTGIVAYIIFALVLPRDDAVPAGGGGRSGPLQIAEERFARGEISADELRTIREALGDDRG